MTYSFRTNGNYIDFVHTDNTSLQVENVLKSLHNTSRCVDWSLPDDTTRIDFTIDEDKYHNILITEIDFDGTAMNSQDDFETGIISAFPGLAGSGEEGGSSYLVYTPIISQASALVDPTAIVLQNTLGGNVVWTRGGVGAYAGTLAGAFTQDKTYIAPFGDFNGDASVWLPIWAGSGAILGYYTIYLNVGDDINMLVKNLAGVVTDLFDLIGSTKLSLPETRVYP